MCVGGWLEGSQRCAYLCPSIRVGHSEQQKYIARANHNNKIITTVSHAV